MSDLLVRIDRTLSNVETPLNLLGGVFIMALAGLGITQVILRSALGLSIPGYIDFVEQGTAFFAFLGLAYTQRTGAHIRMELLLQSLPRAAVWRLEVVNTLFAGIVVVLLIPGAWQHFLRAFTIGDSTMGIRLPTWPTRLLVVLALVLLLIRIAVQLWGFLRLSLVRDANPIAVPLPANAAELAAEEIENTKLEGDK